MGGSPSRPLATSLKHCTLWKADRSPACRAVMMALDAMNIDVREVDVNLDKGEQKSSTIFSMNPLQTLPILKDKDLILCDSHAITTYMASRYGSEMTKFLLPTMPRPRAYVDQFLHFNSSVLYPQYRAAANPILYGSMRNVGKHTHDEIQSAYAAMERMLSDRAFFSNGNWPSLGDISMIATLSTLNVLVPIDVARYPKLTCWLRRMSEEKFYCTANMKGLTEFTRRIDKSSDRVPEEFKCPRNSEDRRNAAATLTTANTEHNIYPKLTCWLRRMSEEKFYCTANMKGLTEFTRRIDKSSDRVPEEFKCPRNSEDRRNAAATLTTANTEHNM